MIPSKIKIESFAKRCHMGTLGGKGLTPDLMHPFLGMYDGRGYIAFLLSTDTGDAGTSPHVARRFF